MVIISGCEGEWVGLGEGCFTQDWQGWPMGGDIWAEPCMTEQVSHAKLYWRRVLTWRVRRSQGQGLRRTWLVLGRERRPVWLDDTWKGGQCLQWSEEEGRDQRTQGLGGHSIMFVFYSKCRWETLEDFKQGSIVISCLCGWLSSPLCAVANKKQPEGDKVFMCRET